MKPVVTALIQSALILATAYLLVATSRPPCTGNASDTQAFAVSGDCGPSGIISVTSNATCGIVVDGGAAVLLPGGGEIPAAGPIFGQRLRLTGMVFELDGGTVPLADGGVRTPAGIDQTGSCIGGGCPPTGGNFRICASTLIDGGTLALSCSTDTGAVDSNDSCSARLVPVP